MLMNTNPSNCSLDLIIGTRLKIALKISMARMAWSVVSIDFVGLKEIACVSTPKANIRCASFKLCSEIMGVADDSIMLVHIHNGVSHNYICGSM